MKKQKNNKITILILCLISIITVGSIYFRVNYSPTNFEEIIFSMTCGLEDSDNSIFIISLLRVLPFIIVLTVVLYSLLFDITFGKKKVKTKHGKQIYPIKTINTHKKIFISIAFIMSIGCLLYALGVPNFVLYSAQKSNFIEKNYVNAQDKVTFDKKKNLILIMVESLETSYFTKNQNGYWDYELIPELHGFLEEKDAVTFYNKNKQEGVNMLQGSSWTTASIVSNLSGVPLKVGLTKKTYGDNYFVNGAYSLGDLLKDNGYYNEVISGARTSFGGLKEYFSVHGDYAIVDEDSLSKYNLTMNKQDVGNWGFNDRYLFETAKKRLDIISKEDKPFNLELITIDTHFVDGFVGDYSINKYDMQYENAYATSSKLIYDFIEYVKKQDYYKDTTIVILGDHLTMQHNLFSGKNVKDRYVYNCIINPYKHEGKTNNRTVTALDYYPTIVYSIGGNIKGNRLGLGTNLFSKEKTLAETYGLNKFSKELMKKSDFYNKKIMNSKGR